MPRDTNEREIPLMQDYRTRLTADLVTGKLNIGEAAGSDFSEDDTKLEEVE